MKILITGSNGQLGQSFRDIDSKGHSFLFYNRYELDITDASAVKDVLNRDKPDWVINAAAYTAVDKAEQEEQLAYKVNLTGAKNLAEMCLSENVRLLHVSTDYVFDGFSDIPYRESDEPAPLNVYGKSKLAGEHHVLKASPEFIVVRTSWVFSEYSNNFFKTMLKLAETREELSIVSDQVGGPTYARSLAKAILNIIFFEHDNKSGGVYHYCGLPYVSWFEFAQEIFSCSKGKSPVLHKIKTADYKTAAVRPLNSRLSKNRFSVCCIDKDVSWKEGLKLVLKKIESGS